MNVPAPRSKVPAVTQAVAILRYLGRQPKPAGVVVIARAVAVSPSSCFNILKTLAAETLVSFDETTKTYALGSGTVALARRALDPENTLDVARSLMRDLAVEFDATCTLWRVSPDQRLMLLGLETGEKGTRLHMTVGQRLPLPIGAVGRSVVAASSIPGSRLKAMFHDLRWEAAPTLEDYLAEVEEARRNGWAVDRGAFMRGVTSIAAAVLDDGGAPQLAISNSLLGAHHEPDELAQVGRATAAAARRLRRLLYENLKA